MKHVLVVALLAIWCFPSACEAEKLDKIVVYGSQTCTYTGAFRGKLKQNGNQYVFKDIANGRSNAEMWNIVFSSSWYAGGSVSLPVVVVNGVAYERPEFNYVLNLINQGNGLIESCDVGLVSGQVYDSSGVGVLANIYLLNESDAGEFIHVCWTDSLGAYKCQGVSPGTYKVIVTWATNRQPFANIYGMSGNTFNVGAGESVTIENITVNGIDLEPALVLPTQARGELYWECADVLRKNYIFYLGFGTMNIFNISSNKLNVVQSGSGGYFNDIQYLPVSKLFGTVDQTNQEFFLIDADPSSSTFQSIKVRVSGLPRQPTNFSFTEDERMAYISCNGGNSIAVVDIQQSRFVKEIALTGYPQGTYINNEKKVLYVGMYEWNNSYVGRVAVIDIDPESPSCNSVVKYMPVSASETVFSVHDAGYPYIYAVARTQILKVNVESGDIALIGETNGTYTARVNKNKALLYFRGIDDKWTRNTVLRVFDLELGKIVQEKLLPIELSSGSLRIDASFKNIIVSGATRNVYRFALNSQGLLTDDPVPVQGGVFSPGSLMPLLQ